MSLTRFFTEEGNPPWITSFLLATLSAAIYEVETTVRHQRYGLLGFEELDTLFENLLAAGDIEASILRSENVVVVVFRGSEDLDEPQNIIDWLSNASMSTAPYCASTFIHKGFASLATLFIPEILVRLDQLTGIDEIWLTGHSLGGAVAQAVGYCLHISHPITVRKVVTFGAPRIGGALKWATPARVSGYRVDRWVNSGDPVPRLPSVGLHNPLDPRTHNFVAWTHYGQLNYIDWLNSQIIFDDNRILGPIIDIADLNFSDHGIVNYKHRVFDLMPSDIKSSMLNAFTETISIGLLLKRAQQDLQDVGETVLINSIRDLITSNNDESIIISLRFISLKYL